MTPKEELKREFEEWYEYTNSDILRIDQDWILDWVASKLQVEAIISTNYKERLGLVETDRDNKTTLLDACAGALKDRDAEISRLSSLLKVADEVIVNASYENMGTVKFMELVNKYNTLKHKLSNQIV